MTRVRALLLVPFVALALGCPAADDSGGRTESASGGRGVGAGGSPAGGSTGSSATGGAVAMGGSSSAPGSATGGSAGSSAGGAGNDDAGGPDLPAAAGAAGAAGDVDAADGAPVDLNDPSTWPGGAFAKPFIRLCPDGASKANCCMHYCTCMMTNCSKQIPADCLSACMASDKWDMRCRVYNCFESLNPLAQKDHTAHCEHAGVYTGTQRTRGAGDTHEKCHMPGDPDEK
jgi:hypothetical protein